MSLSLTNFTHEEQYYFYDERCRDTQNYDYLPNCTVQNSSEIFKENVSQKKYQVDYDSNQMDQEITIKEKNPQTKCSLFSLKCFSYENNEKMYPLDFQKEGITQNEDKDKPNSNCSQLDAVLFPFENDKQISSLDLESDYQNNHDCIKKIDKLNSSFYENDQQIPYQNFENYQNLEQKNIQKNIDDNQNQPQQLTQDIYKQKNELFDSTLETEQSEKTQNEQRQLDLEFANQKIQEKLLKNPFIKGLNFQSDYQSQEVLQELRQITRTYKTKWYMYNEDKLTRVQKVKIENYSNKKNWCQCNVKYKYNKLDGLTNHVKDKHNKVPVWIWAEEISIKKGRPMDPIFIGQIKQQK